ncbi:MAG: hypothetical protein ACR2NR_00865 [Solirubrobacteraceae bacterium]
MTDQAQLEQRYRRLLAWYPRAFRTVQAEEMLVVLMASARNGKSKPGPADSVNLIANALLMRLRPRAPRSVPTVFWAVRLMALGAGLELVALATVVATQGSLSRAIARHFSAISAAHVHSLAHQPVPAIAVGAPIASVLWLLLAWGNGRGRSWARPAFAVLVVLTSVSLISSISYHVATLAPADLAAGAVLWLVALVALALILSPPSEKHYRRPGDADRSRGTRPSVPTAASLN